jgi:hypothetical protein
MPGRNGHDSCPATGVVVALLAIGCTDADPIVITSSDAASDRTVQDRTEHDHTEQDRVSIDAAERDASDGESGGRRQLFNGRDFSGWTTYLGPPNGSTEPVGVDRDPRRVFSVVEIDGGPTIRISGEIWGALTTIDEFENYHLHAEFKWGALPPWHTLDFRDSGLMYHSVGSFGAVKSGGDGSLADPPGSGYFMRSMQLQISEPDVGGYYSMGPITVEGGGFHVPATTQQGNRETWNTLDIYVLGNESVHVVNRQPVVHVRGATLTEGGTQPLTRGKIQLESESAEIYFRAITVTPLREIPPELG